MQEDSKSRREITVITRSEPLPSAGLVNALERLSKVLSLAAIPLVLAAGGWVIQRQLQNQTVSRDYVQLAISILEEPNKDKVNADMRKFAVGLLRSNSPVPITEELAKSLESGATTIPTPKTSFTRGTVVVYSTAQDSIPALVTALNDLGYTVSAGEPPVKNVTPDVRYYHPEDKDSADEVIGIIKDKLKTTLGLNPRLSDPTAVKNHSKGTIEVWLK